MENRRHPQKEWLPGPLQVSSFASVATYCSLRREVSQHAQARNIISVTAPELKWGLSPTSGVQHSYETICWLCRVHQAHLTHNSVTDQHAEDFPFSLQMHLPLFSPILCADWLISSVCPLLSGSWLCLANTRHWPETGRVWGQGFLWTGCTPQSKPTMPFGQPSLPNTAILSEFP